LLLWDTFRTPTIAVIGDELLGTVIALFLVQFWEETAWAGVTATVLMTVGLGVALRARTTRTERDRLDAANGESVGGRASQI
jgi:hypothetical protein